MQNESPQSGGILRAVQGVLLWIGGAVAGVTALLYSCGYLVMRAHLSMLGLHGLIEYGNEHFLQEGAKFLIGASYDVVRTSLPLAAILIVAAGVALIPYWLLRRVAAVQKLKSRIQKSPVYNGWRHAAYALLLLALVGQADAYLESLQAPLATTNLLYESAPLATNAPGPGAPVHAAYCILTASEACLAEKFESMLFAFVIVAVLTVVTWRLVGPWRWRRWLISPFVLTLAICVITLPMAYGVLQRPVRYPLIELVSRDLAFGGPLFLMQRTDAAFVVWDAKSRRVIWVPAGQVERAEIGGFRVLFSPADPADGVAK